MMGHIWNPGTDSYVLGKKIADIDPPASRSRIILPPHPEGAGGQGVATSCPPQTALLGRGEAFLAKFLDYSLYNPIYTPKQGSWALCWSPGALLIPESRKNRDFEVQIVELGQTEVNFYTTGGFGGWFGGGVEHIRFLWFSHFLVTSARWAPRSPLR